MKSNLKLDSVLGIADLGSYLNQINERLIKQLKINNPTMIKPATRIVNASGKQLRPSLVVACSMINGKTAGSKTIELASAVELVHVASLVHDDIIDEAFTRRNVPTISGAEGINHAIIIGDYMFAKACQQATFVNQTAGEIIAQTIADLCDGQSRELADKANLNRSVESYTKSIEGKTASLIAAACQLGGLAANLSINQQKALYSYGWYFGLAFQIIDDLLDIFSTTELYGKPIGNDITEGTYTLPVILGLKTSTKIKHYLSKPQNNLLADELLACGAVTRTLAEIQSCIQKSTAALRAFDGQVASALKKLPAYYLDWVINNQVADDYKTLFLEMKEM